MIWEVQFLTEDNYLLAWRGQESGDTGTPLLMSTGGGKQSSRSHGTFQLRHTGRVILAATQERDM